MNSLNKTDWKREIISIHCQIELIAIVGEFDEWLNSYASIGDYLLAHSLDGVIWGRFTNNGLILSHDMDPDISPPLRPETLQQLRLFSPDSEIYLWKTGTGFQARQIIDGEGDEYAAFDENHILWGTTGEMLDGNFTLMADGAQGLRHVVPLKANQVNENNTRICLFVRHYLGEQEDTGVNYIAYSRLTGLKEVAYAE